MSVCDKCGATCNQLFKGENYMGPRIAGCNPDSPQGRGYYMLCKACRDKKNRADAQESAVTTAVYYFVLQLALFAAPGIALFLAVNRILGVIIGIAGIVGYFVLRVKFPKILRIINISAVAIVILCIGIRGCNSSDTSSDNTESAENAAVPIIPQEPQEEDTSKYDELFKNIENSSSEYSPMF